MRLRQFRPALHASIALALSTSTLTFAQYVRDSSSASEQLRVLRKEVNDLGDALRSRRNTPSPRSSGGSTSDWLNQMQAAEAARTAELKRASEQRRADAEWKRDHPNETRYQYYSRMERERDAADYAASVAGIAAARAARVRAQEAEYEARRDRQEKAAWENYRAANHNFIPRSRAPVFSTPTDALAWYLAHDRESPNPWAAGQAAILLIDGYGIPADPAAAARLLDPRTRREPAGEQPRPELAALFAYLRAVHPEVCVPLGVPTDPAAARRDLEALAIRPHNDVARWYLARLLSESPVLADQKKALQFLPEGYAWMIEHPAGLLSTQAAGGFMVSKPVDATATTILAGATVDLPEALATWPLNKISAIAVLVYRLPEPQLNPALMLFADTAAERYLTGSPSPKFPYNEFDYLLVVAGSRGSSSAHAIALFERLHFIRFNEEGKYTPSFLRLTDRARSIPALSRWAQRDDALGVRARLALSALAFEVTNPAAQSNTAVVLPEPFASVAGAIERYRAAVDRYAPSVTDIAAKAIAVKTALQSVYAAIARRDASAPPISAMPSVLDSLALFQREQDQLIQLNEEPALVTSPDPALFAIGAASFNLDRAALQFDAAHTSEMIASSGTPKRFAKLHALFEATRLGDAFAPSALSQDPDFRYVLTSGAREKLRTLSNARRARDEAARRPRALTARVLEACLRNTDPDPALVAIAAANGSRLAARLQFDQRLKASLAAESDARPSAQVSTALVNEFDTTLLALDAQPPASPEWQFLGLLMEGSANWHPVEQWFPHIIRWTKDRDERLASAALVKALRPGFEAVIVTLSQWPGLNHEDYRREDWLDEADQIYLKAKDLIATDGVAALTLCLEAAGRGNRDALGLLAYNLRNGLGTLPRTPEFADLLLGASLKIAQTDAELGDSIAAYNVGLSLMEGDGIAKNPAAGREWLRYSAGRGNADAANELRNHASSDDQPKDPAAERHWASVMVMARAYEQMPVPPRRLGSDIIELTPLRPALEAALTAANASLAALKTKRLNEEEIGTAYDRYTTATQEARRTPATGIVQLAQLASTGNQGAAFSTAQFLAGGISGLRPDQPLARRFHALALELQQTSAEFGDADEAYHLGLHHLELAEKRDPATAIRWLTYAAELGHHEAVICLRSLYDTGAPGILADPKAAARWTAFGETITIESFKPRAPLR